MPTPSSFEDSTKRERPFSPEQSGWSAHVIPALIVLGLLLIGGMWLYESSLKSKAVARPVPTPAPVPRPQPAFGQVGKPTQNNQTTAPDPTQSPHVYRCNVQGATTYSDAPCKSTASQTLVAISPNVNLSSATPARPAAAATTNPPPIPTAQGTLAGPALDNSHQLECSVLEQAIRSIDESARMPISAQEQDWLVARREEHRDRQFRLGC